MNSCKINIWGRAFELSIMYECYPGEEILDTQKEAFNLLADSENEIVESLDAVKKYVRETESGQLTDNSIENIFRYVMPKSIFVPHIKNRRTVAIMCDYKFDIEHGIAVVFETGKFKKVGTQDIIL